MNNTTADTAKEPEVRVGNVYRLDSDYYYVTAKNADGSFIVEGRDAYGELIYKAPHTARFLEKHILYVYDAPKPGLRLVK